MSTYTHYFVVGYHKDRGFFCDTDVLEAQFPDGCIWDEDLQEYLRIPDQGFREYDADLYSALLHYIRKLNEEGGY